MGGLIYLVGSPLFWGLFILASVIGALFTKLFTRKKPPAQPPEAAIPPEPEPIPPLIPPEPLPPLPYPVADPADPPFGRKPGRSAVTDLSPLLAAGPVSETASAPDSTLEIEAILRNLGYGYDARQNVFYSLVDAWQRRYGYCALYDDSTAPSGMIIDSEPFFFTYRGRRYMLELWKGQYGMTTGCEIGFYRDSGKTLLGAEWYESVPDSEMLDITATLIRDGTEVFTRRDAQWWLTGFRLGMFSQPSQLAVLARITFPDCGMCCAFLAAARRLGYTEREAFAQGMTVTIYFSTPRTRQPATRTRLLADVTQAKNRVLCEQFSRLVGGDTNMYAVLGRARSQYPEVYASAMRLGRSVELLSRYTAELPGPEL